MQVPARSILAGHMDILGFLEVWAGFDEKHLEMPVQDRPTGIQNVWQGL